MLAPEGGPSDGGPDRAGRNCAARATLHFVKGRSDRRAGAQRSRGGRAVSGYSYPGRCIIRPSSPSGVASALESTLRRICLSAAPFDGMLPKIRPPRSSRSARLRYLLLGRVSVSHIVSLWRKDCL